MGQVRWSESSMREVPFVPAVIMVVNAFFSASGAVYTERVLKAQQSAALTIFATNLHMSAHTLLLNGAKACLWEAPALPSLWAIGDWTWAALANEAVNGLAVSALMRHADCIVKNYAFSTSIFTTALISVPMLGFWPNFPFLAGAMLVALSMYLYSRETPLVANGSAKKMTNGHGAKVA